MSATGSFSLQSAAFGGAACRSALALLTASKRCALHWPLFARYKISPPELYPTLKRMCMPGSDRTAAQATIWAALSGVGLALVLPCVQAIIAELYTAFERGRAFGFLFTVSALGEPSCTVSICLTGNTVQVPCHQESRSDMCYLWRAGGVIGTFCAISFGNRAVHGVEVRCISRLLPAIDLVPRIKMEGLPRHLLRITGVQVWRVLFWAMAGISLITCVIILTMAVEPRSINKQVSSCFMQCLSQHCRFFTRGNSSFFCAALSLA